MHRSTGSGTTFEQKGDAVPKTHRTRRVSAKLAIVSGDSQAVARLMKHSPREVPHQAVQVSETPPEEADAIIWLLDYAKLQAQRDQLLREMAGVLAQRLAHWGERLLPAQRSVFVVLYNWEKFVDSATWPQVLEWLEERKLELLQQLERHLMQLGLGNPLGFGRLVWRMWAVSLAEAELAQASCVASGFGVVQLFQQAWSAAADYAARRGRQNRLALGLVLASGAVMAGVVSGLLALAWRLQHSPPTLPVEEDPTRHLPPTERLAWWLDRGRRLLRWEDWRQGSAVVLDWPGWLAQVQRYRNAVALFPHPNQPEAQIWLRALQDVTKQLARVQERACLLGVEGASQGDTPAPFAFRLALPESDLPGTLRQSNRTSQAQEQQREVATLDDFLAEVRTRLQQARDRFPAADLEPLPGDLSLEVAEDLRQLAEQRYLAALEPVRAEIRRQVYRLGEGQETLAAWRQLVQRGWLSGAARRELADWLTVVQMLQVWSGRSPTDPLDALSQLVLQETVPLPLGRLWLIWPDSVKVSTAQPDPASAVRLFSERLVPTPVLAEPPAQLRVSFLLPDGRDTVLLYQRLDSSKPTSRCYEYRLATTVAWPGECYAYRPGVGMRVHAQVKDTSGQAWQLTWSEREARSQVFGFTVLELTPRCHPPDQPPESGSLLHGARLQLSVPLAVPDLLP